MSRRNRARRQANREARIAGEQAARARARRQRWALAISGIVVAAAVALYFVVQPFDDDDDTVAATDGDTTTTIEAGACVAVADPLPEGAPEVPVKVGPPPTELVVEDLVVGDGEEIPAGATVTVDYIGVACSTGTIFDDSYSRGEPATFGLNEVIAGWTEGIPGMKVGGQRLLGIPSGQAYGANGSPPDIGPNEALWFVVEAVSFEAPTTPTS